MKEILIKKHAQKMVDARVKMLQKDVSIYGPEQTAKMIEHSQKFDAYEFEGYLENLATRIDLKDISYLIAVLHAGNKHSIKFFEEYTGTKLGTTKVSRESGIHKALAL